MFKKILFITGHRKSGTTMFANLFDQHKDFLVYPTDLCLLYAYFPYFIQEKSYLKKKARILHIIKKDFGGTIVKHKIENKVNLSKFYNFLKKRINKNNINNIKKILNIVLKSFEDSLNYKKEYRYLVVKETSADLFFNEIFKKEDDVTFIHLIRDPRDNYASLKSGAKKYYSKLGESEMKLLSSTINRAKLDFKFIDINKSIFGKSRYLVIKYDELTKKTKKTMMKICKFLKIKFDVNLLKPTILGAKTSGNNFDGENFSSVSSKNVGRWHERITMEEAKILEIYFENEMKRYGYKISKINKDDKYIYLSNFYKWVNKNFYYHDSFKTK